MNKYEKAVAFIRYEGFDAYAEDFHLDSGQTETGVFMKITFPSGNTHIVRIHEHQVDEYAEAHDKKLVSLLGNMRERVISLFEEINKAGNTSEIYEAAWSDAAPLVNIAGRIDRQISHLEQLLNTES